MANFLRIDGGTGGATATGYEGWTLVHGIALGLKRELSSFANTESLLRQGPVMFTPMNFNFVHDLISDTFFASLCKAEVVSEIDIHVCVSGRSTLTPYIKLKLENCYQNIPKNPFFQGEDERV
jgi:type VI protein secretion system component Hcp